jgi:hypothetical protein
MGKLTLLFATAALLVAWWTTFSAVYVEGNPLTISRNATPEERKAALVREQRRGESPRR